MIEGKIMKKSKLLPFLYAGILAFTTAGVATCQGQFKNVGFRQKEM